MTHKHVIKAAYLAVTLIAGCKGGSLPDSTTLPAIDDSKQISELQFKDPALKACVNFRAVQYQWKTINQFTTLECGGQGKTRLFSYESSAIKDLSGIEQLTALKTLDIPGHGYRSIDVSALTQLETLNLYEAFIDQLDLSHNTKLQSINVGATAITSLNLTGLKALKKLYANFFGEGYLENYTQLSIKELGEPLGLKLESLKTLKKSIRLDAAVKLTHLDVGNNADIDLPSSDALISVNGRLSLRSLAAGLPNAEMLNVTLLENTELDLSSSTKLKALTLVSDQLKSLKLNASIESMNVDSPLTELYIPRKSPLSMLTLRHIKMPERMDFMLPTALKYLVLTDIQGKVIDIASAEGLTNLTLDKVQSTQLYLPVTSLRVNLINLIGTEPVIAPAESVTQLDTSNPTVTFCSNINVNFTKLKTLNVMGCNNSAFSLLGLNDLTTLYLNMPLLKEIDLSQAPTLNRVSLTSNAISDLDLTSFANKANDSIVLSNNNLSGLGMDKVIADVKLYFSQWALIFGDHIEIH